MAFCSETVGMGITSWKSYDNLIMTLDSYRNAGFLSLFDDVVIYFQDQGEREIEIANAYGIRAIGGPNTGIAEGMRGIAQSLNTDLVLFMENDCPLIEPPDVAVSRMKTACSAIIDGHADIVRLRHRFQFGQDFHLEKFSRLYPVQQLHRSFEAFEKQSDTPALMKWMRRAVNPFKAKKQIGASVYFEQHPDKIFPEYISKLDSGLFVVDSAVMNWTNQSVLCRPDFFLNTLMPYVDTNPKSRTSNGFQSPERALNSQWWRNQHFKISVSDGLFTHNRFEDSWRRGRT